MELVLLQQRYNIVAYRPLLGDDREISKHTTAVTE
jgi:hypothetical protein